MKKLTAILLLLSILCSLAGCASEAKAENLMKDITPHKMENPDLHTEKQTKSRADFAVELLKHCAEKGKNTLISPLSVLFALSMTANGAKGETLSQIENVLGAQAEELNRALQDCRGDEVLLPANSIWLAGDQGFVPEQSFLQINADYYGAEIYEAPFEDPGTVGEINRWCREKTKDMIPEIIDQIPEDTVMYLINALAFEAEWEHPYEEAGQSGKENFTDAAGKTGEVPFLYGEESQYLEDGEAVGFTKSYAGGRYAFAAILPEEGTTPEEYLNTLTGEKLTGLLREPQICTVHTAMPKFETEYEKELSDVLKEMGMPLAFTERADFSAMGSNASGDPPCINRVLHKTFISVGEKGTRAGAVTAVEMKNECAVEEENPRYVTLDRPFLYMIFDRETETVIFMGILNKI